MIRHLFGTLETTQRLQTLDDIFILEILVNMSHEKQQIKVIDNSNNVLPSYKIIINKTF